MELNVRVADLCPNSEIQGYYILKEGQVKKAVNGKPFLSAVFSDATGSIDAKMWDFTSSLSASDIGRVVLIRGEVSEYRGAPQITVSRFRFAAEQDKGKYELDALVPSAPVERSAELEDIRRLIASMEDEDYRRISEEMLRRHEKTLATIPAAKSIHHGFRGGLLMHTASMLRIADFLASNYPFIDRSLLLAGTLMHDLAKEEEFSFSSLGLVTEYSVKGELLGHLVMGAQEVAALSAELGIPEGKSVLLQHLLLSHHGSPETGAAMPPKCAEAELLSTIDLIDSRMEIYAEVTGTMAPGTFSNRIFALEKRIFRHE